MTNAIVQHQSVNELGRIAKMLAMSGYFASNGNMDAQVAQLATRILAGQELGFGPFASANNIHIIKGKPVIGANLMASAVKSNPRYDYRVRAWTNDECRIEFLENGKSVGESTFSMADAKQAGLAGKDNWKNYPRNMLFARAMSNGVRLYCPDVFGGNAVYTGDELDGEEWHVVDSEPSPVPQIAQDEEPDREVVYMDDEPPTAVEPFPALSSRDIDLIALWMENTSTAAKAAQDWAIIVGACANEFEAHNSMKKIINESHSGTLNANNLESVLYEYVLRQREKLSESAEE